MAQEDVFKKLVAHCKEYGFVFPSSDIYDGIGGNRWSGYTKIS